MGNLMTPDMYIYIVYVYVYIFFKATNLNHQPQPSVEPGWPLYRYETWPDSSREAFNEQTRVSKPEVMEDSLVSIFIIRIYILSPLPSESGTDYLAMLTSHAQWWLGKGLEIQSDNCNIPKELIVWKAMST